MSAVGKHGRVCRALLFASALVDSFSIPGSDIAIFLKSDLTLWPAFADVSMNMMFSCCAFAVASSSVTCLEHRRDRRTPISTVMGGGGYYAPFVRKIGLVADEDDHNVVPSL
jgi:hypothetical protein